MRKIVKTINILLTVGLIFIAAGVAFIAFPQFGNQALIVRSGSMAPTIDAGSIVVVSAKQNPPVYKTGDIIAFRSEKNPKTLITHRVVEVKPLKGGGVSYQTKGDANEEADGWIVGQKNVLGKTYIVIPYVGQILAFAKSDIGFPILIILPAIFVILIETFSITREIRKRRKSFINKHPFGFETFDIKKVGPLTRSYQGPTLGFKILIPLLIFSLAIPSTLAFFSDSETSTGNVFQAAEVFPTPIPSEPYVDEVTSVSGTFGHCCSDLSSDPSVAAALVTGAPDSPPTTNFIQISSGSSITARFNDNKAVDGPGNDIRIHIYDALFPADANIEISADPACVSGFTAPVIRQDTSNGEIDLAALTPAPLTEARCVRITDLGGPDTTFPTLGFDLDAIEAINSVVNP